MQKATRRLKRMAFVSAARYGWVTFLKISNFALNASMVISNVPKYVMVSAL